MVKENLFFQIVSIENCVLCKEKLRGSDVDVMDHLAFCVMKAQGDVKSVGELANAGMYLDFLFFLPISIVLGGFLTEADAQRKWYTKVLSRIGYGSYGIGENNANIIVQNRRVSFLNRLYYFTNKSD
jgi:phosphatidylserine decarboxylase